MTRVHDHERPHVALVHDNFVGPTGMGLMTDRLARGVLDLGWELTVVGSRVPTWLRERATVRVVADPTWLPAVPRHLAWCAGAARAIRSVSADIVHVHSPLLARRADLLTSHFMAQPAFLRGVREHRRGPEGVLRRGQEAVERRLDDRAYRRLPAGTHVSFVSEFLRDEFRRHYGEPRGGWITAPPAPSWRPVSAAQREAARSRWGLEQDDRLVVGYIGGDNPRKGLAAVRSLASAEGVTLLAAGPGSERLDWPGARGLGFVDPDQLYEACDVVVAPSVFDSAPVAVLQALARGVPVVITPTTGWAHAVARHGAGVVWDGRADLAQAVRAARSASPGACRAVAEEFSERSLTDRLQGVYREILAAAPDRSRQRRQFRASATVGKA
jgi:glycosyltransferase involved in cell wall biosynthesis